MELLLLDYLAITGNGLFHKASPWAKVLYLILVLAGIVLAQNLTRLALIFAVILLTALISKLPVSKLWPLLFYPLFFATVFAVSRWEMGFASLLLILGKALAAVLVTLTVIVSTPYPLLFAVLARVLPRFLVDVLFLTYRSFFILAEQVDNFLRVLKLRGGYAPKEFVRNIRGLSPALGLTLLRSLELSERMYAILRLRGYRGGIAYRIEPLWSSYFDLLPLIVGLTCLLVVLWP